LALGHGPATPLGAVASGTETNRPCSGAFELTSVRQRVGGADVGQNSRPSQPVDESEGPADQPPPPGGGGGRTVSAGRSGRAAQRTGGPSGRPPRGQAPGDGRAASLPARSDDTHRRRTMAEVDYFLKIDGIAGESHDDKHKGEIDVESWTWGETNLGNAPQGGGLGAGKVAMQDFHFVVKVSKATPQLLEAVLTGLHFPTAVLTCRKAGGKQEEFLKYTFTNLMVTSVVERQTQHDSFPRQEFSLNFHKVECEYKEQKA